MLGKLFHWLFIFWQLCTSTHKYQSCAIDSHIFSSSIPQISRNIYARIMMNRLKQSIEGEKKSKKERKIKYTANTHEYVNTYDKPMLSHANT